MDKFPRIRRQPVPQKLDAVGYNIELVPYDVTFRDKPIGLIFNTHYNQRKIRPGTVATWRLQLTLPDGKPLLTKLESPDFEVVKQYVRDNYEKVLKIAGHVPG